MDKEVFHGTTILAVRHKDKVVVAGDGQVTLGSVVTKHKARKVRRIYNDKIIVGFAGATADALTLSEKLEQKLERYNHIYHFFLFFFVPFQAFRSCMLLFCQ